MKCPVCGAKMVDGKICKYCNVTSEQVYEASNKAAKIAFKEKRNDDVCYTTDIPKDVNKTKLTLFTIFLGVFGVGSFYVGRLYKGLYSAITAGLLFVFSILDYLVLNGIIGGKMVIGFISSLVVWLFIVNLLMWISDVFGLVFKTFKVPVVLPENEIKVRHHSIKK